MQLYERSRALGNCFLFCPLLLLFKHFSLISVGVSAGLVETGSPAKAITANPGQPWVLSIIQGFPGEDSIQTGFLTGKRAVLIKVLLLERAQKKKNPIKLSLAL